MGQRKTAKCGTYGGYQRHRRLGETPCDACREANRVYGVAHRERNPVVESVGYRNTLARDRALRKLARMHPQEFKLLFEMEKTGVSS